MVVIALALVDGDGVGVEGPAKVLPHFDLGLIHFDLGAHNRRLVSMFVSVRASLESAQSFMSRSKFNSIVFINAVRRVRDMRRKKRREEERKKQRRSFGSLIAKDNKKSSCGRTLSSTSFFSFFRMNS